MADLRRTESSSPTLICRANPLKSTPFLRAEGVGRKVNRAVNGRASTTNDRIRTSTQCQDSVLCLIEVLCFSDIDLSLDKKSPIRQRRIFIFAAYVGEFSIIFPTLTLTIEQCRLFCMHVPLPGIADESRADSTTIPCLHTFLLRGHHVK